MRIICPNCQATYEVGDADIPQEGIEVECSACLKRWMQMPQSEGVPVQPAQEPPAQGGAEPEHGAVVDAGAVETAPDDVVAEVALPSAPDPEKSLRQALTAEGSAPSVADEAMDMATPSLPETEAEPDVLPALPEEALPDTLAAEVPEEAGRPSSSGMFKVPPPPSDAFLESDPLDEILAEVGARAEVGGEDDGGDSLDNDADVEAQAADPRAEPIEDTESEAVSGPSFGGVEIAEVEVEPPAPELHEALELDSPGELDVSPSVPDYDYTPPAASEGADAAETPAAGAVSGVEAIWQSFTASEDSSAGMPEPAPALDADADKVPDVAPDARPFDAAPEAAPEPEGFGSADLADVAEPEVAPFAEAVPEPAVEETEAPVAVGKDAPEAAPEPEGFGSADLADVAEPEVAPFAEAVPEPAVEETEAPVAVGKGAPEPAPEPAPAPHWSEVVAAAPVTPLAMAAKKGMEDFIRDLKEEAPSGEQAAMPEEAPVAIDTGSEEPEAEEVFHPWEGATAPEISGGAESDATTQAAEEAQESAFDDDFEWEEEPTADDGAAPSPQPEETDSHMEGRPAPRLPHSDEDLLSPEPEISNVIQAQALQPPAATMESPAHEPVEAPRKPTPVESTDDIEAAIRAQLTSFPKREAAAATESKPEKSGVFGKIGRAKVQEVSAPAAQPAPAQVDPLKAALHSPQESPRSGKRTGFLTVMVLFVLLAVAYLFGDSLSAMVPALAPVIDGVSGVIDGLRGIVGGLMGG